MSRFADVQQQLDAEVYKRLVYPDSGVMVNRFGLRTDFSLKIAERFYTNQRLEQGLPAEAHERTYDGLKAIHKHLFQDVYAWAGQQREYTTRRSEIAAFAPPASIARNMDAIFSDFRGRGDLKGLAPASFAKEAAHFVSAINGVHPFNDGNGRTQRAWLADVADAAGHHCVVRRGEEAAWHDASRVAFERGDKSPMADFIQRLIEVPERTVSGPGQARAEAFLALSRSEALASGDPALRTAWQHIDALKAVAGSARPDDKKWPEQLEATARAQIAERFRAGREIEPLSASPLAEKPPVDRLR